MRLRFDSLDKTTLHSNLVRLYSIWLINEFLRKQKYARISRRQINSKHLINSHRNGYDLTSLGHIEPPLDSRRHSPRRTCGWESNPLRNDRTQSKVFTCYSIFGCWWQFAACTRQTPLADVQPLSSMPSFSETVYD